MQRIALLSDIHGNLAALEAVVADLKTRQVDTVFNLGDHVSGPLWPKETIQFLMKQNWIQIKGNHERQLLTQKPEKQGLSDRYAFQALNQTELDWLASLPASTRVQEEFLLVHATPLSDLIYLLETVECGHVRLASRAEIADRLGETRASIILCGHTHVPRVVKVTDECLIVNPGSVGLPAYSDDTPEPHVVETGSPHARYAILEQIDGHWQAELIALSYDHHRAAKQARQNGRSDWEVALRTGFMYE